MLDSRAEQDALIAATALVHGMTVATRNAGDFEPMGIAILNPWADAWEGAKPARRGARGR